MADRYIMPNASIPSHEHRRERETAVECSVSALLGKTRYCVAAESHRRHNQQTKQYSST